jgi:tetratricopeptide (TPR) repeat protein
VDQARTLNSLGALSQQEGAYMLAREQYEHALVLARAQETRQIEGRALRGLGDIARHMGHFVEARRYYNDAAAIANELNTPPERCAILHRQGELYISQEQYPEALEAWIEALAQDQRIDHPERDATQKRIEDLVAKQHLEKTYKELCRRYHLD